MVSLNTVTQPQPAFIDTKTNETTEKSPLDEVLDKVDTIFEEKTKSPLPTLVRKNLRAILSLGEVVSCDYQVEGENAKHNVIKLKENVTKAVSIYGQLTVDKQIPWQPGKNTFSTGEPTECKTITFKPNSIKGYAGPGGWLSTDIELIRMEFDDKDICLIFERKGSEWPVKKTLERMLETFALYFKD